MIRRTTTTKTTMLTSMFSLHYLSIGTASLYITGCVSIGRLVGKGLKSFFTSMLSHIPFLPIFTNSPSVNPGIECSVALLWDSEIAVYPQTMKTCSYQIQMILRDVVRSFLSPSLYVILQLSMKFLKCQVPMRSSPYLRLSDDLQHDASGHQDQEHVEYASSTIGNFLPRLSIT